MNCVMDEANLKWHLHDVAKRSLARWGIDEAADVRLISLSENGMFLVTLGGDRWVLRVHRTEYHSANGVRSELAWMRALQAEAGVETPQAIQGLDGEFVQFIAAAPDAEPRMVVLFEFIPGREPEPSDLGEAFVQLGSIAANMHAHARSWVRPSYFERLVWDVESALGEKPNWGHWREGFAQGKADADVVERADALMRQRLLRFGQEGDRFGLIHSDLRLANLLVADGRTKVLDFDDCGLGWFLYDVASSMTFLETHPDVEAYIRAWIDGYLREGRLTDAEIAEIPTMMMLRRLVLMGWAGSHPKTDLAREMGEAYTVETVTFADRFLTRCAL